MTPRRLPMDRYWLQPADVLPPRIARRMQVTADGHWILQPVQDGRRRGPLGARQSKGYALIGAGRKGKNQLLSHMVLTAVDGPPAPGQQACHNDAVCDVRHCVAPRCLRWASAQENQRDATIKRLRNRAARQAA